MRCLTLDKFIGFLTLIGFTEFLPDDEDIKCDAWIDAPLYFVDRWDTTNPYQAHQDFLNAFTSYATVRPPLDPTSARIVLLDPRQPDGPYTKAWTHIFSRSSAPPAVPYDIWDLADRVKRMVAEVGGRGDKAVVCMKRSVWGAHVGYRL
ncbi:hypothetical protein BC829DRAFT_102367 [Chytridium lagenaria]|nr:hypothetical protein BC829DRAFT_102367 [Chytridium lagenaria]